MPVKNASYTVVQNLSYNTLHASSGLIVNIITKPNGINTIFNYYKFFLILVIIFVLYDYALVYRKCLIFTHLVRITLSKGRNYWSWLNSFKRTKYQTDQIQICIYCMDFKMRFLNNCHQIFSNSYIIYLFLTAYFMIQYIIYNTL